MTSKNLTLCENIYEKIHSTYMIPTKVKFFTQKGILIQLPTQRFEHKSLAPRICFCSSGILAARVTCDRPCALSQFRWNIGLLWMVKRDQSMAELQIVSHIFTIFDTPDRWFWHHFTNFSLWLDWYCFYHRTPTDNSPSYYSVHHGVNDIEATWTLQRQVASSRGKKLPDKSIEQKTLVGIEMLKGFSAPELADSWSCCPGMQRPVFTTISKLQRSFS